MTTKVGDPTNMDDRARKQNEIFVEINKGFVLCSRCDGTGNELFWMYRRCSGCAGQGVLTIVGDHETE